MTRPSRCWKQDNDLFRRADHVPAGDVLERRQPCRHFRVPLGQQAERIRVQQLHFLKSSGFNPWNSRQTPTPLETLAAALRSLSADDRARFAAMVSGQTTEAEAPNRGNR
jgi:hypothetical protein